MTAIDPITREVVQNRLITVVREMSLTLQRAAYSPIIHEVKDYSSVLLRPNADLVAESEGIPSFLGAMPATLAPVLAKYGLDAIGEGDIFVSNDPYSANGTHKNDINVIAPIFHDGDLVYFSVTKAHWSDIGGKDPGSWSPDATSTFQEGVSIPPVRLYRAGVLNDEALALILANTREPENNYGDLMAQIAAGRIAERRIHEILPRYGRDTVEACIDSMFEYVEKRARAEILALPDGTYEASETVESDGVTDNPVHVTARVIVSGSDVTCDFTGHEAQRLAASGNINSVCLEAMCRVALKCLLAPMLPANQGLYRPISVISTPGTVTGPVHPAPCTTWGDMGYAVYEAIFAALAPVLPTRVVAGLFGYGQTMAIVGRRGTAGDPYVHFMPYSGGWGGRTGKDGLSATCPLLNGDNFNIPCEVIEHDFPLRVERYELIQDSAGAGKHRGGLGVRTDYRVLEGPAQVFASLNRCAIPPRGLFGGSPAALNFLLLDRPGGEVENHPKAAGVVVPEGGLISHQTAGGGGYGEPHERDPDLVRTDVLNGYVSLGAAQESYGWEQRRPADPQDPGNP
jgi:N-methylhydantoinase B